jgi:uncharacterized protein YyaL (SSP411 family)
MKTLVAGFLLIFSCGAPAMAQSEAVPTHTNRLAKEKSPYLLQHARNPVDWYPWGEEAFAKAKKEDKPVLLSVGYSTCHWCHVMEEESFSDEATAAVMNRDFVSIKVDREERPDIDSVYMNYVIATTGSGGWPMNVFLTPDKKPFYGGTYFPPENRFGMTGFKDLLGGIADAWKNRRGEILKSADSAAEFLSRRAPRGESGALDETIFQRSFGDFAARFDSDHGGFGRAPKFPMGHSLSYLLRIWNRSKDEAALEMTAKTLFAMARGGIYDQIGGGFHRYSTDGRWFLPHFEKMLYDNALLSRAYLEAYQATHEPFYAETAREILNYVLRDMTGPEGAFFSAQDADSPDPLNPSVRKEGAYYVWQKSEIEAVLGKKAAQVFSNRYGVEEAGNVLQDPQGEFRSKNVLFTALSVEETAARSNLSPAETLELLSQARKTLLAKRAGRPAPPLDDKVLTDWNGLMIASFAFASRVLNEPRYREAAERAAGFLESQLRDASGKLLHRYRDGEAGLAGNLDDYAFTVYGFLNLYEASFDVRWLESARALCDEMIRLFWDPEGKGFFLVSADAETLITRPKADHDGAVPSGNSIAVMDLAMLYRMTGSKTYKKLAEETLEAFSPEILSQPTALTQMLSGYDFLTGASCEIVLAGDPKASAFQPLLSEIYSRYLPNRVLLLHPTGADGSRVESLAPFLKDYGTLRGKPTVYVCRNFSCQLPVTEAAELRKLLKV